jgi:hypothetical protein
MISLILATSILYLSYKIGVWVERNRWKYGNHFIGDDGVAMKLLPMKEWTMKEDTPVIWEKLD